MVVMRFSCGSRSASQLGSYSVRSLLYRARVELIAQQRVPIDLLHVFG